MFNGLYPGKYELVLSTQVNSHVQLYHYFFNGTLASAYAFWTKVPI